jgi:hypothetical protein
VEAERAKERAEQEARLAHAQAECAAKSIEHLKQMEAARVEWKLQQEQSIQLQQQLQQLLQQKQATLEGFRQHGSLFGSLYPGHASAGAAAAAAASSSSGPSYVSEVPAGSEEFVRVSHSFHANLAQMPAYKELRFELTRIEKVKNDALTRAFFRRVETLEETCGSIETLPVYHGTNPKNIPFILANNLQMGKAGKTDSGWFGAGL